MKTPADSSELDKFNEVLKKVLSVPREELLRREKACIHRNRRIIETMKKPPDNPEFRRFTSAMRDILKVSKTELQRRMEDEKTAKRTSMGSAELSQHK